MNRVTSNNDACSNNEPFSQPFVEKPVSAEEHDIHIYYPKTAYGGGVTELFRKKQVDGVMRSSIHKEEGSVRRDGSYIYEPFYNTGGTDLKCYAVGVDYVYAEGRKAPVVDGFIDIDSSGKESRYPIVLTEVEKKMVADTARAFKQTV